MKKSTFLIICALFLYVTGTKATDVSGTVTSNTTWTAAGSPYIVVNNIEVYPGITLTIENGVEVKFNSGRYLYVRGTLNATGVKFTGNAGVTKGFWDGIYVSYEYNEVGNVNLTNCTVEYASNLYIRKGQLTLNNCLVNNLSGTIRIHTSQCTLNIDNTTISNTNFPITYYAPGVINPGSNIVFSNNAYNFVDIDFSEVNELFWLKNFGQPYFNDNSIQVRAAGTLKMDPGVNLQIQNTEIRIYGKIKAIGTKEKPVIFDKSPASSYWLGLNILNSSIDTACIVKNAIICNANYNYHEWYQALEIENASPTIDSCLFYGNAYNLHIYGDSKPVISNTVLRKSITTASEAFNLIMDMNANPTFTNDSIQFNNTEIRAIGIRENTVSKKNAQLKKINFIGLNNISYCLYNTTTVHDTASLIIDPGVVIKWRYHYSYIIGNGKITAIGTDAEPIVFTHLADDTYGNPADTQNDGTQTPGVSNAGRIMLYSTEESRLEKCKILYGGYDSNNWAIYLSNANVVNNCEIKNSYNGILFTKNAKITNNAFVNMPKYTIGYTLSTGNPILTGNTVANMGYIGILLDGTVTNDSPTLKKMNFAGYTNLPYILTSPLTINQGNLVTINPGVVIKFHNYWNQGVLVNGGLKAIGTKTEKIIFTSIQDDSAGGDTNNNGTGSVPGYDDWKGICFSSVSSDADNVLKNCEVRYAGDGYIDGSYTNAPLAISSCKVIVDSVKVNFSSRCGIAIFGDANPEIKNTTISNINWEPIYMDMFSNPKFDENITLANVANIALKLKPGIVSGTVPIRSFAGYNPITYGWFDDALTVNSQLTIPAGLTFKGNGRWNINGKLNILGTADNPVVFTTSEDDTYGKPKDGQQNGQAGYNQNANYFVFYDASNDSSVIENTIFRYSYQVPIQLNNASPTIRNCKFENFSKIAISLAGNSAPAINNCVFTNVSYPFNTSLLTYPSSTVGNVMTGSTGRGIRVNDETLTQDSYLPKRAFGGMNNIPYVFRNYTIGSSAKLTVEPGVVLKFEDYGYINVQNGLIANGGSTTDSAIIFTSARDDFYGGDTYNNGTADAPWNSAWRGIYFYNESIDDDCILKNCIIKYGSYSDRGAVTLDNASPKIQNCRFEKGYHGVICLNTSLPTLSDCDFIDTEYNNGYAVWNKNSANTVTATNCYFNSNTGPRHSTNPLGTGTRVSDYVNFTPFKTFMAKAELGDVSLNGTITAYDASLILQHTVSNITLTPAQRNVADITKNGAITAYDASQILQYNVGLILTFTPNPSMIRKNVPALASADIHFGSITPTTTNGEFIVPIRVNSGSGVKSIDMQLGFNANHLNLTKITSANMNNDISFSNSENFANGNISLSMASAYDLDLNDAWVYLTFRLKNPMIDVSEIRINNALANETEVTTDNPTLQVQTRIISSTANLLQNEPLNIWANENGINIDLEAQALSNDLLITLSDVSGRTVFTKNYNILNRKFIEIPYSETGNLQNGIYLIQVNAGSRNFSEKLIINRK